MQLWTRALRHHFTKKPYSQDMDKVALSLRSPLKRWLSKLRQTFQQYYDPLEDCLLIPLSATRTHSYARTQSKSCQLFDQMRITHLTSFQQTPSTQKKIAVSFVSSAFWTQAFIIPPTTIDDYIATFPPARQRLLAWANPCNIFQS